MTENTHTQTDSSKNYFVWIHVSLLIGALIVLYWQSFQYWVHTWINNHQYHFAFLIPFLSAYIIWTRRTVLASTIVNPSKSGLIIIIAGIILYIGGQVAYANSVKQLSFFIIIPGIILYYFGFAMLKRLSIALAILVFMVPWAGPLYPFLQKFFAWVSVKILHLLNFPVYLENHFIQLPNLSVDVATGCSGIRYITALLPLGLTIGYLHVNSLRKRLSVIAFAIVVAILANLLRILTVLVFALRGNTSLVYDHITLGYVLYIVAFAMLLGFASLIGHHRDKHSSRQEETKTSLNSFQLYWPRGFSSYGNLAVVAIILLLPAAVHARISTQPSISLVQSFRAFPLALGDWKVCEFVENEWRPEIIGATDNLYRPYADADGNEIRVFFSYLVIQKQGKELVYHANKIIPPHSRVINKHLKTWTISANPHPYVLKTKGIELSNGTQETTLLYWYRNTDRYLHNKYMAKAFMALDSLLKNRSNGAVFVLMYKSASYGSNDQDAKIQDFLNHFMPEISKYLPS